MLRIDSKNVNYSAACMVNETQVAYFNANRNGSYRCDVSISIDDLSMYLENLATFENDFVEFMADVSSIDD